MKIFSIQQTILPTLLALSPIVFATDEQTMIVSATPQVVSKLDTPAAVSMVDGKEMHLATPRINLSKSLTSMPGLQVQNQQNYAQDLQLSIHRFGSHSTYRIHSIHLYVDSIPTTMPNRQGQTSNINLSSVQNVEVLHGPFSALYGNTSGSVMNVTTQTRQQPPTIEASSYYSSFGSWHYGLKATGTTGDSTQPSNVDYTISTTRFTTHSYHDHSGTQKNLANAKLGIHIDEASKLSLIFNSVDIKADDPGGLTKAEWKANPQQAPHAEQYNTRKTIKQTQAGLHYEHSLSSQDDMSVMMYAREQETTQYQSIPMAPQLNPSHTGSMITLQHHYQGIDSHWTHHGELGIPVTFTTSLNYKNMSENHKGYNNFHLNSSMPEYRQKGELHHNKHNLMWNINPYLQTQWQLSKKLSLDADMHYSSMWFDSNNHYITPGNSNDSSDASYHKWLPASSLKYAMTNAWNIYLAARQGFETPTINELSYHADGQSSMNLGLKPSTNNTIEISSKTHIGDGLLSLTLFQTNTDDEIVVNSSSSGHTTYKNARKTHHQGTELAWDQHFTGDFHINTSWTWLDATYHSNVCNEQDCNSNQMPGITHNMGFASIGYVPEDGWYAGTEARYMGNIMADDENTAKAPSYTLISLFTRYKYNYHNLTVDLFGHVNNLFNKEYIGSVIVNESNRQYYKPSPRQNYGVSMNIAWRFE